MLVIRFWCENKYSGLIGIGKYYRHELKSGNGGDYSRCLQMVWICWNVSKFPLGSEERLHSRTDESIWRQGLLNVLNMIWKHCFYLWSFWGNKVVTIIIICNVLSLILWRPVAKGQWKDTFHKITLLIGSEVNSKKVGLVRTIVCYFCLSECKYVFCVHWVHRIVKCISH